MLFLLISPLNLGQLSAIHQRLLNIKDIKNVQMKTLSQYCPNVHIFMFHGFGLAAAQIEILY